MDLVDIPSANKFKGKNFQQESKQWIGSPQPLTWIPNLIFFLQVEHNKATTES